MRAGRCLGKLGYWLAVMVSGSAMAAVPIAENGAARAVIVHNGHTAVASGLSDRHVRPGHIQPAVDVLADYLQQITGAVFEQVATEAEAGDRPTIVFELVGKVPGAFLRGSETGVAGGDEGPQWEKAARGTDGREYPWGNVWEPEKCVSMENTLYAFKRGFRAVGSHPEGASPYGVEDMAGGVWEWVRDWTPTGFRVVIDAPGPDAE